MFRMDLPQDRRVIQYERSDITDDNIEDSLDLFFNGNGDLSSHTLGPRDTLLLKLSLRPELYNFKKCYKATFGDGPYPVEAFYSDDYSLDEVETEHDPAGIFGFESNEELGPEDFAANGSKALKLKYCNNSLVEIQAWNLASDADINCLLFLLDNYDTVQRIEIKTQFDVFERSTAYTYNQHIAKRCDNVDIIKRLLMAIQAQDNLVDLRLDIRLFDENGFILDEFKHLMERDNIRLLGINLNCFDLEFNDYQLNGLPVPVLRNGLADLQPVEIKDRYLSLIQNAFTAISENNSIQNVLLFKGIKEEHEITSDIKALTLDLVQNSVQSRGYLLNQILKMKDDADLPHLRDIIHNLCVPRPLFLNMSILGFENLSWSDYYRKPIDGYALQNTREASMLADAYLRRDVLDKRNKVSALTFSLWNSNIEAANNLPREVIDHIASFTWNKLSAKERGTAIDSVEKIVDQRRLQNQQQG